MRPYSSIITLRECPLRGLGRNISLIIVITMNSNDLISVNYDKEITEQEGKDFINNMNEINLS